MLSTTSNTDATLTFAEQGIARREVRNTVLTADEVRARFEAEGLTIKEWAEARGYHHRTVYAVLKGELRCTRGKTHRIAVDLGLKAVPATDLKNLASVDERRAQILASGAAA